jgi:transcriptional regulator with XRE-family HTH domain
MPPRTLREHRRARYLSQQELAARAGVSLATINKAERQERLRWHLSTMRRVADALGVDPTDIAEFAEALEAD